MTYATKGHSSRFSEKDLTEPWEERKRRMAEVRAARSVPSVMLRVPQPKKWGIKPEQEAEFRTLWSQGMTRSKIAAHFGVSLTAVTNAVNRMKLRKRKESPGLDIVPITIQFSAEDYRLLRSGARRKSMTITSYMRWLARHAEGKA